jgi:accessory gene regulator protein AgrB
MEKDKVFVPKRKIIVARKQPLPLLYTKYTIVVVLVFLSVLIFTTFVVNMNMYSIIIATFVSGLFYILFAQPEGQRNIVQTIKMKKRWKKKAKIYKRIKKIKVGESKNG